MHRQAQLAQQQARLPARWPCCSIAEGRPRSCRVRAQPDDGENGIPDVNAVFGDWREVRAKLIASQGGNSWAARVSDDNQRLLQIQSPALAAEEVWAHATALPEKGGLLLASPDAPLILGERLWQAVVLLVEHSPAGSAGLILNRPSGLRLGLGDKGGLPYAIIGAPEGMQAAFAENRVYCGGMVRQDVFHLLHGHPIEGSIEVVPGVRMGGEAAAVAAVRDGQLPAGDFKYFSGCCVWGPGELQSEVDRGAWLTAACSRSLALKQVLQLPVPLWKEVLGLMGGKFADLARDD